LRKHDSADTHRHGYEPDEITPAMIAAGVAALDDYREALDDMALVKEVYISMVRSSRRSMG
jgi:hypothetical protein